MVTASSILLLRPHTILPVDDRFPSSNPTTRSCRWRTPDVYLLMEHRHHNDVTSRGSVANTALLAVCELPPSVLVRGEKGASAVALFLLAVISVAFNSDGTHGAALSRSTSYCLHSCQLLAVELSISSISERPHNSSRLSLKLQSIVPQRTMRWIRVTPYLSFSGIRTS